MEAAPFHKDLSKGPQNVDCVWLKAQDGIRLRAAFWPEGEKGTVFIFPGRTEIVEKYGTLASELAAAGYASLTIDWRGQGLADRLIDDPVLGHVGSYADYQLDYAALLDAARQKNLPEPYFLIAHSMGGAIGLRALIGTHPFKAAMFSAPMWGIQVASKLKPLASLLPGIANFLGLQNRLTPSASRKNYVATAPFEGNILTRDADMFALMKEQIALDPMFALGGPTIHWFTESIKECKAFQGGRLPDIPGIAAVGTDEAIVDPENIAFIARSWTKCEHMVIDEGLHELLMEQPMVRMPLLAQTLALFEANRG